MKSSHFAISVKEKFCLCLMKCLIQYFKSKRNLTFLFIYRIKQKTAEYSSGCCSAIECGGSWHIDLGQMFVEAKTPE